MIIISWYFEKSIIDLRHDLKQSKECHHTVNIFHTTPKEPPESSCCLTTMPQAVMTTEHHNPSLPSCFGFRLVSYSEGSLSHFLAASLQQEFPTLNQNACSIKTAISP